VRQEAGHILADSLSLSLSLSLRSQVFLPHYFSETICLGVCVKKKERDTQTHTHRESERERERELCTYIYTLMACWWAHRCLGPYIDETICLILEMDNILKMDKAMKAFGFPVGPLTLADEAGVEVAFHLHENLQVLYALYYLLLSLSIYMYFYTHTYTRMCMCVCVCVCVCVHVYIFYSLTRTAFYCCRLTWACVLAGPTRPL
jgi:hypothetical protein